MEKMPKRFQLHLRFDRLLVLCTLHSLPSFVKVFKQSEAGAAVANPREKKRVPIDLGFDFTSGANGSLTEMDFNGLFDCQKPGLLILDARAIALNSVLCIAFDKRVKNVYHPKSRPEQHRTKIGDQKLCG